MVAVLRWPVMDTALWIEVVGYLGSAFVIFSLMQKSILKLRVIGLVGSVTFFVYSILIEAYPIAVVNVIAAAIHIYYLRKLIRFPEEIFSVLHVLPESRYLAAFMEFHADDMARYQPEFTYEPSPEQFAAFILRDMVPAGLIIGRAGGDRTVEIRLDYAIPQYRDFKLGKFLYSDRSGVFANEDCDRAWATATTPDHAKYLEKMGFQANGNGRYVIDLTRMQGAGR